MIWGKEVESVGVAILIEELFGAMAYIYVVDVFMKLVKISDFAGMINEEDE